MTVVHLDTEKGSGSIQHLIDAGKVVSYDASTFEKAEQVYWALFNGKIKADLLVLDTVSTLAQRYARDMTFDKIAVDGVTKTWWNQRDKMRTNQDVWRIVNFGMNNLLTGMRGLAIPSIFLVHEGLREDPVAEGVVVDKEDAEKRHQPLLTPKIRDMVMAYSDIICRIYKAPIAFAQDGKQYPINTRVLQLESTPSAWTGVRLTPEAAAAMPSYVVEPTLQMLAGKIGGLPHSLTIYGFPKTGKTVLACTLP